MSALLHSKTLKCSFLNNFMLLFWHATNENLIFSSHLYEFVIWKWLKCTENWTGNPLWHLLPRCDLSHWKVLNRYSSQAGTHAVYLAVVIYALLVDGQHRKIAATQSRVLNWSMQYIYKHTSFLYICIKRSPMDQYELLFVWKCFILLCKNRWQTNFFYHCHCHCKHTHFITHITSGMV